MTTKGSIGGEFILQKTPSFLKDRVDVFDKYYAKMIAEIEAKPHDKITVTLPDGSTKEGEAWKTTPLDIANQISSGLAQHVVAAKVDDAMYDLTRVLEKSCTLKLLKFEDEEGKNVFWHSSAHMLGEALENYYGVKLCTGPAVQDGFYYDAYMGGNVVTEKDYSELEKLVKQYQSEKQPFQRLVCKKEEAMEIFSDNPFKIQILSTKVKDGETTTLYRCGTLIDLCRGPHLPNTQKVKGFAVTKNSACYWLGDASNDSLQRVYGTSFPETKQLKEFLKFQEEAKKNDHRRIGEQQDLFFFHELSPGSCFFMPHGARIYNRLIEFIREQYRVRGYTEVISPNVFNFDLWKISGHGDHYRENMFLFKAEDVEFGLKPMNCPGHCLMFKHSIRSYRDLPMRYADFGVLHRNELSGALSGLTRVRRFQQDDSHIFCRQDQIKQEVSGALDFMKYVYDTFGMTYELELSTRPEKSMGDIALWDRAEAQLTEALNEFAGEGKWKVNPGDGAFYGPKIDIKVMDSLKRQHQTATVQLDFQLPLRFELKYKTAKTGEDVFETPVIVHRAMLGSVERCFAILCEHFKGKWPFWLSPRQAIIVPVSEAFMGYANEIKNKIWNAGFDVEVDDSNNTLNKKIREAQVAQFNYILVVGKEEESKKTVNVRTRENVVEGEKTVEDVIKQFCEFREQHK